MTETDSVTNHEPIGWVIHVVESARNGAGIGTFSARSLTHQGTRQGNYTVTFEVRPIPLREVHPARIEDQRPAEQRQEARLHRGGERRGR
jgi:hypothetical protein